ncbi:MAG: BglII/BstYI family type II restriction endonuclease [Verrucomicrobia bacterium]|nr:BglII/BstYI family type II restriction endonuclease [Verrucomicrobiota bacterium]
MIQSTNPSEWDDIVSVIDEFCLSVSDVLDKGGNKSDVASRLDEAFRVKGWREGRVDTVISLMVTISPYRKVGETESKVIESNVENRGYKVDNIYGRIALDVEWNAKDGNLDRDVGAYRALYDAALIDAAVLITRTQEDLRMLALHLDPASTKFATTTTTNLHKLRPRLTRGDAGGCPVLAIAITSRTFSEEAKSQA